MSRVSVKTSAFTNTVGTFPSSDFTDLNGFDGQVRVQAAGFCHNGFGNVAHARAIGTFLANQYAAIKVTGMTGAPDSVDQIGVSLRLGTGVRGAAGVTGYSVRLLDAGTQTLKVYKVVADVETVLGTLSTPTFVNGDVLSAEATGTSTVTFAVYQNATLLSNSITDTPRRSLAGALASATRQRPTLCAAASSTPATSRSILP